MPTGVYDHREEGKRRRESDLDARGAARQAEKAARDYSGILERVDKLRELLYEAEKVSQWLSSAVSASELPAGSWIFVDAMRMGVLASMRTAQLLQLEIRKLAPPATEEKKSCG